MDRAIFEATSDGLIINDLATGLVLEANPAACRMHGYDDMVGLHPTAFIHPDDHHLFADFLRTVRAGGEFRCRARDVRRDGSVFDVDAQGRGFTYRGRPAVLGVVRDVTDEVRAVQELERRVAERTREIERRRAVAEGLRDLLAAVNARHPLSEILADVADQSRRLLGSDASAIFLPVPGREAEMLGVRACSELEPAYANVLMPITASSTGLAFRRRQPVLLTDLPAALPAPGASQEMAIEERDGWIRVVRLPSLIEEPERATPDAGAGLRDFASAYGAFLSVPLAVHDAALGTLSLYYRRPRDFDQDEVALASTFAAQAALAIESARLRVQAEQAAALEERQRLARELHDAVTQTLFSASLIAEAIPDLWDVNPAEARRRLEQVRRLARGALAEMRMLLLELRPGALAEVALPDLLRQLAQAAAGNTGADVALAIDGEPRPLPAETQLALYRIAQEALSNVAKHARARHVALALSYGPAGEVALRVDDDGRGFDPAAVPPGRLGTSIMRERADGIGACLQLESRPGGGTRVEVRWREGGDAGHERT
ncbi:MAG: PAS domain S-box protein [Thermomicrobiaceae bacterium]|nr:PAS domain S-box protein [Thermomicrobiaceae bacterium]